MKPVLSRAQMRAFDAHLIDGCRVPGLLLMENAGRGATDVLVREGLGGDARGKRVVIVCGAGNNGGDGFVIARHLRAREAQVALFCTAEPARIRGDARVNHDAFAGTGGAVRVLASGGDPAFQEEIGKADAVVDALFGTGLDRPIVGEAVTILAALSAARGKRVAIDIPSGIDADTGATLGASFEADFTVTFAHPKLGLLTPRGARAAGALHVVDLGVPGRLGPALTPAAELLEAGDVAAHLAPRAIDSHKNSAGHVGVFAGSEGKVGAALMVAHGALRAGAGLATIASWDETAAVLRARVTEEMVTPLVRGPGAAASVKDALAGKKVIVAGPGFGTDADARAALDAILGEWSGPAVYDADALTTLAATPESFARGSTTAVLTPHPGEAARLLGSTAADVEADRYAAARALSKRTGAVVILKGAYTLVADPAGRVVVNPAATPALATAGSGDTLAGILGAMLCALPPLDAACAAVFIHAAAAAAWSEAHGDRGLLASEIALGVPSVLRALTAAHTRVPR